ncbi:hypothetical protein LUR56_10630 [Streptomyces sp. MT29]|nr:hypothetical protein [Streptomyces sp. MT29]
MHAGARAHALEGLHAARRTGQPNSSVHLHAVLALAASVEGPAEACAAHCVAALTGAGPHGLAQPLRSPRSPGRDRRRARPAGRPSPTWARARADLAAGRVGGGGRPARPAGAPRAPARPLRRPDARRALLCRGRRPRGPGSRGDR